MAGEADFGRQVAAAVAAEAQVEVLAGRADGPAAAGGGIISFVQSEVGLGQPDSTYDWVPPTVGAPR